MLQANTEFLINYKYLHKAVFETVPSDKIFKTHNSQQKSATAFSQTSVEVLNYNLLKIM